MPPPSRNYSREPVPLVVEARDRRHAQAILPGRARRITCASSAGAARDTGTRRTRRRVPFGNDKSPGPGSHLEGSDRSRRP